ncbi:MAG: radical SAM protein, partial [Xenococcus sp. (in: cyanobacteria)]
MIVRNLVVFVNPPNTSDLKSQATESFTCGVEHTDWANFPHLGILSLASFINLKGKGQFKVAYFDGVVCPWKKILNFIIQNKSTILAVCVSCLTASYGSALRLLEHVKKTDSSISTLVGNDHFSALYKTILVKQNNLIDYGLVGNEIYESLFKTLMYLKEGKQPEVFNIPGLSAYKNGKVILGEQKSEAIFTEIDYSLLDSYFPHSEIYQYNFQNRISPRIDKVFGLQIRSGVPVEIARGCIKFKHNNACSF